MFYQFNSSTGSKMAYGAIRYLYVVLLGVGLGSFLLFLGRNLYTWNLLLDFFFSLSNIYQGGYSVEPGCEWRRKNGEAVIGGGVSGSGGQLMNGLGAYEDK
jgi:hypothetical protein